VLVLGVPQQLTQLAGTWRVGPARVADRWDRIVECVGAPRRPYVRGKMETCARTRCVYTAFRSRFELNGERFGTRFTVDFSVTLGYIRIND
jgi:hypothetical protein